MMLLERGMPVLLAGLLLLASVSPRRSRRLGGFGPKCVPMRVPMRVPARVPCVPVRVPVRVPVPVHVPLRTSMRDVNNGADSRVSQSCTMLLMSFLLAHWAL